MSKGSCHFLKGKLLGAASGPPILMDTVEKMWDQWGSGKEPLSAPLGTRAPFSLVYGVAGGTGTLWERFVRLVLTTAEGRRGPAANGHQMGAAWQRCRARRRGWARSTLREHFYLQDEEEKQAAGSKQLPPKFQQNSVFISEQRPFMSMHGLKEMFNLQTWSPW